MSHKAIPLLLWIFCCGGSSPNGLPAGAQADTDGSDSDEGGGPVECDDEWTTDADDVSTQPDSCLLWSPRSETQMNWYDAASEADGLAGNCGSDCPEPGDGYCATLGQQWRLPTISELKEASKTSPDIENGDGWLWSGTTGTFSETASTADLSRGGVTMDSDKEHGQEWVRCVSDG